MGILTKFGRSSGRFEPVNLNQFLALRIAHRLNDLHNLRNYLVLIEHFQPHILIACYKRAIEKAGSGKDFLAALRELTSS